jgi:acetyltransferase-like isoleucine patch superfamily enzyme
VISGKQHLDRLFPRRPRVRIAKTALIHNRDAIVFGENCEIGDFVVLNPFVGLIEIGINTQVNYFSVISSGSGVKIGDNVMIGPHVMIAGGNHEFRNLQLPMRLAGSFSKGPIVIENDVWIGANSTILDGVKVSEGCVVGAGSVVTRSTEPYGIYGGCPARKIGSRLEFGSPPPKADRRVES